MIVFKRALSPHRRWSTRAYLALFAATLVLPVLAFSGLVLWQYSANERARLERSALQEAREIAHAVDTQLADLRSSAQILALAPILRQERLQEFHPLAQEIYQRLGIICVLRSPEGREVVNPLVPFGTPLPINILPTDRAVLASKQPQVTDFFIGPVSKTKVVAVTAPVFGRDGEVAYLLNQSFPIERLRTLLTNRHLPDRWVVSIVDRNGLIMARNLRHDEFVGKPATRDLQENTTGQQGTWEGITADGQQVFGVYARTGTGWRVAIGAPWGDLTAPLRRSLWSLAMTGSALIGLSGFLAWFFGQRFATPIKMLANEAERVGQGEVVRPVGTRIREVRDVGEALAATSIELHQRETALRDSEQRLRLALDAARMAVWDRDVMTDCIAGSPELNLLFGFPAEASPTLQEIRQRYAPGELERTRAETRMALERGERTIETELHCIWPDGQHRWLLIRYLICEFQAGPLLRELGVLLDITARKHAEEHQRLLVNELNHRVKNTLATVQSIASQSLRTASTPEEARENIEARLFALSRTHNLLTRENWEGANLKEVVTEALEPYTYVGESRITMEGPEVRLSSQMVLPLSMALHELATNAVKYGALSNNEGEVRVRWELAQHQGCNRLHLHWTESGGPSVSKPTRRGFGTRLVERIVSWELGGEVTMTFAPEGLVCALDAPMSETGQASSP